MEKKASSGSAPLAALALALSLLACALGTGALPDAAFAEEPNAVLNVPTTVPCAVKADGSVVTPGNWSITNEGNGDAALGDVTATDPIDGLSLRASSGSPATEWFSLAGGTVATAKRDTLAAGAAYPVSWAVGKLDPVKNASTLAQAATAPARMATLSFTYTLVPRPQAFAVYSADDNSLTFYKRANVPAADQMFEGKTATEVYEGVEKASYTAADGAPWAGHAAELASVTVADEGIAPVSTAYWFNGASKLRSVDIAALDTSKTTCMDGMFQGCSSLESLDLSAMSTRRVASMTAFLGGCDSLTELSIGSEFAWVGDDCYPPTGNWKQGSTGTDYSESQIPANKTDKYTRVKTAFAVYSADDQSLTFYKRFEVPATGTVFEGKSATEIFSGFETDKYPYASSVPWFGHAADIASVAVADVGIAPKSTGYWFNKMTSLKSADISKLNASNVTNMYSMFSYCGSLTNLDLSSLDTRNVANMSYMFRFCGSLTNLDLSSLDTRNVANMSYMFSYCGSLTNLDLSSFDTRNVANMSYMFDGCNTLTSLDLSSFDTRNVANMSYMFDGCNTLMTLDLSSFDTSKVTTMGGMFGGCKALTALDLSSFDTSKVTTMGGLFSNCDNLTTLDLSSFNTGSVKDMNGMFFNCKTLKTLNLSSFDTINVTNMRNMFTQCYNLTTLDLSSFNTGSVTDMSSMFYDCNTLTSLDVPSFDTHSVTNMSDMFRFCGSLTTLDLSSFDTSKVKNMSSMFGNCKALQEVALGVDWKWVGTNGYLPTPSSSYIAGADRKWHAESDGAAYAPADIPDGKADTYVASKELLPGPLTGTVSVSGDPIVGSALAASVSGMQSAAVPSYEWYAGRPGQVSEHVAFPATEEVTMTINVTEAPSTLSFENVKGLSSEQRDQSGIALCAAEGGEPYVKVTAPDGTSVAAVGSGSWADAILSDGYNYCSPSFELAQSGQYSVTFTWMWKDTIQPDGGIPCQFDMVYQGSASSLVGTGSTYTPTSADVGATVSCKVSDASGRYSGHIEGAASGPVSEPEAFAVYSADDKSLCFYKRAGMPKAGDQFEGKTATAVYTGIENGNYVTHASSSSDPESGIELTAGEPMEGSSSPFGDHEVESASVVDDGIAPVSTKYWFHMYFGMTSCGLSKLDMSNVTDMSYMFYHCRSLATLDVSGWDTSNVTSMFRMFDTCSSLTTLNVSSWNTSKATNMYGMFETCSSLTSLDVSKWDTSNVTSMSSMFAACSSLTSLDVSKWDTSSVTGMSWMFSYCSKLAVNCSTWSVSSVTEHDYFNDGAPGVVPPAWPSSDEEAPDDAIAPTGQEDAAASGSDEGAATEDETSTSSDTAGASGEEEDDGSASGESASGSATGEGDGSESPDGGDSGAAPIEGKLEDEGEELPV